MKYFIFIIVSVTFFITYSNKNNSEKLTQVILSIPDLSSDDVTLHLKNEFKNLSNIDYVDGSLVSNTIVLNVNEQSFNKSKVERMLNRWGLEVEEYAFVNISSSSLYE